MRRLTILALVVLSLLGIVGPAGATPVCTDGFMGGPSRDLCGGRVFPEVANSVDYVQFLPDPVTGFSEYVHGLEYLEQLYPRYIEVFTLADFYEDPRAVSAGPDGIRSFEDGDSGDGYDILIVKLTDSKVPDTDKQKLMFSLSIHGDEKGGLEGGVRAIEDLVIAATEGGTIVDGVPGYESTTGRKPKFHEYEVKKVLGKEIVYLVDFNPDGWAAGDHATTAPGPLYTRQNYMDTDLNRQMPTVGYINPSRNPLEESEMNYGHRFMKQMSKDSRRGSFAYGADIHGEGQSRAWVDIMYPAGQFDSVKHRQHMAIAERTKSVIDATLFSGTINSIEEATGGDGGEGVEDTVPIENVIPTKPARWGTVWDTLGYTDTGFLGDYLATELGVTGMDYEIAFNHTDVRAYGRPWGILFQENYVNASRAIIKTAMAYALYQEREFNDSNVALDPKGMVGYVYTPEVVTDSDGVGTLPGPGANGIGANGKKVKQRPYRATNMDFFRDQSRLVKGGFHRVLPADVAQVSSYLDRFDTLVLADMTAPVDARGRRYEEDDYYAAIEAWVKKGGNLVLIDRSLYVLEDIGAVDPGSVSDIKVYQPYANFTDFTHPMVARLRRNARQLSEATLIGYGIGNDASPMTVVDTVAWTDAGGEVVGTTAPGGGRDTGTLTSVGELPLGKGQVRIMGGGLHMPSEALDHRYGLKDYSLTYSGLFIIENSIVHDAKNLGSQQVPGRSTNNPAMLLLAPLGIALAVRRSRRRSPLARRASTAQGA